MAQSRIRRSDFCVLNLSNVAVGGPMSRSQSNGAVAGPMLRSRVQCCGRGSNVAAGENDLEFELTE